MRRLLPGPRARHRRALHCALSTIGGAGIALLALGALVTPFAVAQSAVAHPKPTIAAIPHKLQRARAIPARPAKPSATKQARATVAGAWTVSLTASQTRMWPNQAVTLTATANQDVGPTPYYLSIYDVTLGVPAAQSLVVSCGHGTTCTKTFIGSGGHYYTAYVAGYSSTWPPPNIQAQLLLGSEVYVYWGDIATLNPVLLTPDTTVPIGTRVMLEVQSTGADVGPSPYWLDVFNATTGTRIAHCGSGHNCSAVVDGGGSAGTAAYIGYLTPDSSTFPPQGYRQKTETSYITWSNTGFKVSLGVNSSSQAVATANRDVGPTPYWIQIYDNDSGSLLQACGSGTTCTAPPFPTCGIHHVVAFIGSVAKGVFSPPDIQASSRISSAGFGCIN